VALVTWVDATPKRTGSPKTQRAYTDTITNFRALLQGHGFDLDGDAQAIADVYQKRLGISKVHVLRHTFAKAMEE